TLSDARDCERNRNLRRLPQINEQYKLELERGGAVAGDSRRRRGPCRRKILLSRLDFGFVDRDDFTARWRAPDGQLYLPTREKEHRVVRLDRQRRQRRFARVG